MSASLVGSEMCIRDRTQARESERVAGHGATVIGAANSSGPLLSVDDGRVNSEASAQAPNAQWGRWRAGTPSERAGALQPLRH
eukprot:10420372-Alexandrium_andersonii.AAC.1